MLRKVQTENGWVRGIEAADPRITAFKGIPFAAPPVGLNRWRSPQPCKNWEGVRDPESGYDQLRVWAFLGRFKAWSGV